MNHFRSLDQCLLTKSDFLNSLRIEKRRVDRSRAPLSIVLFQFKQVTGDEDVKASRAFFASLLRNTRETDIKGWVDHDVIGLILPDTGEKGAERYVQKVRDGSPGVDYSVSTGTYPDDLFQKLLAQDKGQPDLFPLDLDGAVKGKTLEYALKRIIDITGGAVGLLIFSPLILAAAIAVKATSPGPVLFKQSRLGLNGVRFSFYKFRSMYWNTDDRIHREYVTHLIRGEAEKINQGNEKDPLYKMRDDPRITRIGRIIRKTSIDELPQFLNVLRGEMSLVGPRPPLPYEVEKYEPWHLRRILEVKPGMTGLWQVDGRSKTSFDDMVRLDLRYADHWSLALDVKILIKTVRAVLRPSGAL